MGGISKKMVGQTYEQKNPNLAVRVKVHQQGNYFSAKKSRYHDATYNAGGGIRGEVTEFSRASRKRMIDTLAKIDSNLIRPKGKPPLFITLTYVKNQTDGREAKRDLDVFVKRLKRITEDVSIVWRMEQQKRGAIHFHLMVFGLEKTVIHSKDQKVGLQDHWSQVTGEESKNSLDVDRIRSYNGVMYYASKYMAKTEDKEDTETEFVKSKKDSGSTLGLSIPHTSPQESDVVAMKRPGRFWGIYGKKYLPVADSTEFETIMTYRSYEEFCNSIESEYANPFVSFTVYSDNTDEIIKLLDRVWMYHVDDNSAVNMMHQWTRIFWSNYGYLERESRRNGKEAAFIEPKKVPVKKTIPRDDKPVASTVEFIENLPYSKQVEF